MRWNLVDYSCCINGYVTRPLVIRPSFKGENPSASSVSPTLLFLSLSPGHLININRTTHTHTHGPSYFRCNNITVITCKCMKKRLETLVSSSLASLQSRNPLDGSDLILFRWNKKSRPLVRLEKETTCHYQYRLKMILFWLLFSSVSPRSKLSVFY